MNRYVLRLLVVLAVVAVAGFARLSVGQAEETGSIEVDQSNLQIAINVAVYCPDITQSIDQFTANIAIVDVIGSNVGEVDIYQANVQVAYNIALYSPGAVQLIGQFSGNAAGVTTDSAAAVAVDQFNDQGGFNLSVDSSGSSQIIAQEAANEAIVNTGPGTMAAAVSSVISQENVQFAMNVCFSGYILGSSEIPDEWEDCAPEWWWSDPSEAPEAWEAEWWETDAPLTWEEWLEIWEEWWADGAPVWNGCADPATATPTGTPTPEPDTTFVDSHETGPPSGTSGSPSSATATATASPTSTDGCLGDVIAGNIPPAGGGFGTFAFAGCSFEQLLTTSGCEAPTSVFFYNMPSGSFAVWIPGSTVAAVNQEILALFGDSESIPEGTIFTGSCVANS